jgi:hypothetical protein
MHHNAGHLYLRISLRIRNHMQKLFYPLISDQSGIDLCKKIEGR